MERNNKYYTPSIEEFHVGFEHEWFNITKQDGSGNWINSNDFTNNWYWEENSIYTVDKYIEQERIRVKYLDREDIESLGFVYDKTLPGLNEDYFNLIIDEEFLYGSSNYYLDYDYDSHYIRIAWFGEGDCTRFSGIIKNKSELKILLKQIGII